MTKKILVVRFGSLGDLILCSAAIANLRLSFPEHEIHLLTKERFRDVVEMIEGIDELVTLPAGAGLASYLKILRETNRRGYDFVVDLHGNPRSWLARLLVGANKKMVYPKRRRERYLLTRKGRELPTTWPHTIDLYNQAVEQLGGKTPCKRPVLTPQRDGVPESIADDDRPLVVVVPGAAHETKQYPQERFEAIALKLHQIHSARIVWAVADNSSASSVLGEELSSGDYIELVNSSLNQLAAVVAKAAVTVSNDSGIAHLASAVGTPVVAVFGPTHPVLGFAPRGLFDQVVEVDEDCRPCSLHGKSPCYRERQFCFELIDPDRVVAEASQLIARTVEAKPALFVDRDGTLIKDKDYLADPDQIEFIDGSLEALRLARDAGMKLVVVSNQSGVARGYFNIETVEKVNQRMLELLAAENIELDGIYYCPHHPKGKVVDYTCRCDCRKPQQGMIEEAARQLNVDLRRSAMVGDKLDDFWLGKVFGGRSCLVRTGYGIESERELTNARITSEGYVFDDLLRAVEYLTKVPENADRG